MRIVSVDIPHSFRFDTFPSTWRSTKVTFRLEVLKNLDLTEKPQEGRTPVSVPDIWGEEELVNNLPPTGVLHLSNPFGLSLEVSP